MSKDSSVKYYQDNKATLQKNSHEKFQSLFEEEKEKVTIWTLSLKLKNKGLLNIEKGTAKCRKVITH